ncbi:MAG: iron-sulfur cluster assembly scaffold protein [archaeon]
MQMYSEKVMEHFKSPHNMGEIKDADGIGKVGNTMCGDLMWIYIKVKKQNGKEFLEDIKVKTFGCVAAISSSDVLCDMVKGKELNEALKVKNSDIVKQLGDLPREKVHCSVLAAQGLKNAVEDYRKKITS